VLRKDNPTWKVFFLEPSISLPSTEQMIAKLDGIGLSNDSRQAAASITLLTPADGDHTTRVPAPEIAFEQKGDIGELTGIESQYFDPGQVEWSPSAIHWVETNADSTGVTRSPAPFGVGMQPHRWRVWSVNRAGEVTLSEWRTINFTN